MDTKLQLAEQRVALLEQRQQALLASLPMAKPPLLQRLYWRFKEMPLLLRQCWLQRGAKQAAVKPWLLVVCALEAHETAEMAALHELLQCLQADYRISLMQLGAAQLAMPAFERFYVHSVRNNYTGLQLAAQYLQQRQGAGVEAHSLIYGTQAKNAHWALAQAGLPRLAVLATESEAAASRSALQEMVFWAHTGVAPPVVAPYLQALFAPEPRWQYAEPMAYGRAEWRQLFIQAQVLHSQQQQELQRIADSGQFEARFFTPDYQAEVPPHVYIERYLRHWHSGIEPRKPCPGFHPGIYAEQTQLAAGIEPFSHYLAQQQPAGPWQQPVVQSDAQGGGLPDTAVALHIHAYYVDLLPQLLQRIEYNSLRPDLFISVGSAAAAEAAQLATQHYAAQVVVRVVPNRGRDIGPFLTEFGAELVQHYEYIGHIHTKQSLHVAERDVVTAWQQFLLDAMLGGESTAGGSMLDACVAHLGQQPEVAIIYPDEPKIIGWDGNAAFAQALADKMGLGPLPQAFNFPAGTMFWLKRAYLQHFIDLDLQWGDYPAEPVGKDGTVLHALERLFGAAALMLNKPNSLAWATGLSR